MSFKSKSFPCGAGRVVISDGNSKLQRIPNISLVPGKDCGDVPCKSSCYALKALRQYPEVRAAWSDNSRSAHNHPEEYFAKLREYLAARAPRWFRWHVAGDILNQAYLESMKAIAWEFPGTRFLAFTKRQDLTYRNLPDNLAIVFSLWPNWGSVSRARRAGLPIAFMQDGSESRVTKDAIECPGNCENCSMCWHLRRLNRDVVFHKH